MVKEIFGILFPLPSRKREAHGKGDWKSFFHCLPASAKPMVKEILEILFLLSSRKREAHGEESLGILFY
jgi:hypothetical protein